MAEDTKAGSLKDDPDYKDPKRDIDSDDSTRGETPKAGSAAGKEGKGTGSADGDPKR
jgi:hypothetical protein